MYSFRETLKKFWVSENCRYCIFQLGVGCCGLRMPPPHALAGLQTRLCDRVPAGEADAVLGIGVDSPGRAGQKDRQKGERGLASGYTEPC